MRLLKYYYYYYYALIKIGFCFVLILCTLLLIAVGSLSPLLSLTHSHVFVHRIAKTDDFVRRLMEIYQEVLSTGDKQVSVGSGSLICYFFV